MPTCSLTPTLDSVECQLLVAFLRRNRPLRRQVSDDSFLSNNLTMHRPSIDTMSARHLKTKSSVLAGPLRLAVDRDSLAEESGFALSFDLDVDSGGSGDSPVVDWVWSRSSTWVWSWSSTRVVDWWWWGSGMDSLSLTGRKSALLDSFPDALI